MTAESLGPPPIPPRHGGDAEVAGRDGLLVEVLVWLAAILVAGGLIFWLLDGLRVGRVWPFSQKLDGPSMYDLSRSTVALTGLLGATVAVAIGIRRQRSTERSVRISSEAQRTTANAYQLEVARHGQEQTRDLRTRFTDAAKQLGDPAAAVRLAGVYAMAALADDWLQRDQPNEAQSCIDVLCAYVRTPRHTDTDEDQRADIEIKQTIIRAITARLQPDADPERDWRGRSFDFTGATFNGTYNLDLAEFIDGKVSFDQAEFVDGRVSFDGAAFSGAEVTFDGARLSGGAVSFARAKFSGTVSFDGAKFSGTTVKFDGAKFSGATLKFDRAEFSDGSVYFTYASFEGAHVIFYLAEFSGAMVAFFGAEFSGATVMFDRAKLNGGELSFYRAGWAGSTVTFVAARDLVTRVTGAPWPLVAFPDRWSPDDES